MMKAIAYEQPGGPEVLQSVETPLPGVGPDDVRVEVHFAGVNRADLVQRAGFYPAPPGVPENIPGLEYSGVIAEVGKNVSAWKVGDEVFGLVGGGAYAESIVTHQREVCRIPEGMGMEAAGAIPEVFVTAYDALVIRGALDVGETVLIHAVGSGVGTAGLQIAKSLGCTVIGTSRTPEKLRRAKFLGLDHGVVAEDGKFAAAVKGIGESPDVVLDLVSGSYVPDNIDCIASRGRMVIVGLTAGRKAEVNLGLMLKKRLRLEGTALRSRPIEEKIQAAQLLSGPISAFLRQGSYKPTIDRVIPLAEAAEAHRYVASNQSFGKVLLKVR